MSDMLNAYGQEMRSSCSLGDQARDKSRSYAPAQLGTQPFGLLWLRCWRRSSHETGTIPRCIWVHESAEPVLPSNACSSKPHGRLVFNARPRSVCQFTPRSRPRVLEHARFFDQAPKTDAQPDTCAELAILRFLRGACGGRAPLFDPELCSLRPKVLAAIDAIRGLTERAKAAVLI